MSFLTSRPNLSGTIFTEEDLHRARAYLSKQLTKEHSAWLKNPRGPLAYYWRRDDTYAACFLIDFAITIIRVAQNVTARSSPLLDRKIIEGLLNAKSEKQFLENYTEFQVAEAIANFASPLALDPAVGNKDYLKSGNRPRTPDFAIRLPGEDVCMEVTVCSVDILNQWDLSIDNLSSKIQQALALIPSRSLNVDVKLPLKHNLDDVLMAEIQQEIYAAEWGTFHVGTRGVIRWEPVPCSPPINRIFSMKRDLAPLSDEENETLIRSFRNTFDRKHKQFQRDYHSILVLRLGHHRLVKDGVIQMLFERVWPNKAYDWLTGVCLFIPREGFAQSVPGHHLELCPNPNARLMISEDLHALFAGTAQYHINTK